jgi:hypothetical protein
MLIRSSFGFLALAHLSFIPSSEGFSTSRLISSSTNLKPFRQIKKKNCSRRYLREPLVLLRVAANPTTDTDTTTTTVSASSEITEKPRSYDFISVEEAEDSLRRERARYEGERSELKQLIEIQNQQLKRSTEGRRGRVKDNIGRNHPRAEKAARIVVHNSAAGAFNYGDAKKDRNKKRNGNIKNGSNKKVNNDIILRMEQLEARLRDALIDNDELTRRLHEQHRQYNAERAELEDQLREEQDRLDCAREELDMERSYFETSRRMLEGLLEVEQHNVQVLEKELEQEFLMQITREEDFSQQKQSLDQQNQRQEQAQQQQELDLERRRRQEQELYAYNNNSNYNGNGSNQQRQQDDCFTMNINDVQCPLYS